MSLLGCNSSIFYFLAILSTSKLHRIYLVWYMCLNGYNCVYGTCRELQCRFSKDESCSGISQIAKNCSDIYPINPCSRGIYHIIHAWPSSLQIRIWCMKKRHWYTSPCKFVKPITSVILSEGSLVVFIIGLCQTGLWRLVRDLFRSWRVCDKTICSCAWLHISGRVVQRISVTYYWFDL
jgi:hypothetical protein